MTQPDTEKFRLRQFVEKLVQQGECVIHDEPIDLIDVAAVLDGSPKAVWFRNVGPEKAELVGNVMGSRRRLAAGARHRREELLRQCYASACASAHADRGAVVAARRCTRSC